MEETTWHGLHCAGTERFRPKTLEASSYGTIGSAEKTYEDVRRCRDGWEPRQLDAEADADIWRVVRWFGRRAFRRSPAGVVLLWGDQMFKAHRGTPAVIISGPPGEILLYAFGRQDHARVDLKGDSVAVEALATTTLSW